MLPYITDNITGIYARNHLAIANTGNFQTLDNTEQIHEQIFKTVNCAHAYR